MFRNLRNAALLAGALILTAGLAFGQMTTFKGKVIGEDGKGLQGAIIKIERVDIKGNWNTKTDKKGEWIYSGMPVPAKFTISCEVNGKVVDAISGVRSSMGEPQEFEFNLQKLMAKQKALQSAADAGKAAPDLTKEMTPEQKAAFEKATKERQAAMAKNKALNDAYNAGMQAKEAKDWPVAIENFNKASEIDPAQVAVWIQLAASYDGLAAKQSGAEKQATLAKGDEMYQKALALSPNDADLHNNYGLVLARQAKVKEATAELEKATQLNPSGGGRYMYNMGAVLVNTGQLDGAIGAFRKAVELDPKYAPAWFQYCSVLSSKLTMTADGKPVPPEGMKDACEKYLELDPSGPNADAAKSLLSVIGTSIETKYANPDAQKAAQKKKK
jgi:Tfp pilus assembly protein PilF